MEAKVNTECVCGLRKIACPTVFCKALQESVESMLRPLDLELPSINKAQTSSKHDKYLCPYANMLVPRLCDLMTRRNFFEPPFGMGAKVDVAKTCVSAVAPAIPASFSKKALWGHTQKSFQAMAGLQLQRSYQDIILWAVTPALVGP